ncbi:MAG: hypothetical protein WCS37_02315 [Chloroflexota bacterium]|nr:hypothetical protein [Chloroflexota bacterium]
MQLVLLLLVGSLVMGLFFEKLDRKAYIALGLLIAFAIFAFLYLKRFL